MFTGLVEEMGTVQAVSTGAQSTTLTIACHTVLSDAKAGDSISVSGVCLTATEVGDRWFKAQAVAETLQRTTLGALKPGDRVNLERTVAAGERFGGHFVQGHVGGVGTVSAIVPEGDSVRMTIAAPPSVMRYVVEKGSIAVDGISLTVAGVHAAIPGQPGAGRFDVALIPHTLAVTTIGQRRPGDEVNLEADILGKYVDQLLQQRLPSAGPQPALPPTGPSTGPSTRPPAGLQQRLPTRLPTTAKEPRDE